MSDAGMREIRDQFPVLSRIEGGRPFVYLDSAATALTPEPVITAISSYYRENSTNIHRGLYRLSEEATALYEGARARTAEFISASSPGEVIFTRCATESINLVAYSWAQHLGPGDTVVTTELEHHADLVPWQLLAERNGVELVFLPLDPRTGTIDENSIDERIGPDTALVAVSGMSNVTGVQPPLEAIVRRAKEVGAKVLLDAAQLAAHEPIDVQELGIDFLAFSGHKLYGPTGIGVLWARKGTLEDAVPFMSGGDMIERVGLKQSAFRKVPHRFEAGTPHIAGAAGLSAAMDFITSVGWERIHRQETACTKRLLEALGNDERIDVYGPGDASLRSPVVSFNLRNVHPHDVDTLLGEQAVAVRAGLHCAQPYVEKLGTRGTVRASIGMYTDVDDIDALISRLREVFSIFG